MNKMIQITTPTLGAEEYNALKEPIESGWLTQGAKVNAFEKAFADYLGMQNTLATTSCTTALHLALASLNIGPGDEVIVPAFTWVATANVVLYCGAKPVFVDICPNTFNILPEQISQKVTKNTKAIIPVHLFGLSADIDVIKSVLPKEVVIIEDAACAIGAKYKNQYCGTLGDMAAFSFHPRKIITTGEGGMLTVKNKYIFDHVTTLRNHGASLPEEVRHHGPKPYLLPEFNILGYNYRMTDLQGAIGVEQMKKLPALLEKRRQRASWYLNKLQDITWLKLPFISKDYEPSWQSFVVTVDKKLAPKPRNEIMQLLLQAGISTRPGTHAVHMLSYYNERYNLKPEDFPNAKYADEQSMAIPLHANMSDKDYMHVINTLKSI